MKHEEMKFDEIDRNVVRLLDWFIEKDISPPDMLYIVMQVATSVMSINDDPQRVFGLSVLLMSSMLKDKIEFSKKDELEN